MDRVVPPMNNIIKEHTYSIPFVKLLFPLFPLPFSSHPVHPYIHSFS